MRLQYRDLGDMNKDNIKRRRRTASGLATVHGGSSKVAEGANTKKYLYIVVYLN